MRTHVLPLVFLVGSAVVSSAAPALAGPATSFLVVERAASDHADELVKRSLVLAKAEQHAQAEALLREAWDLKRSWDIAGNLGIVEMTLGHWRGAAEHLTYAFKTFPTAGKSEQKKLLEQSLTKALTQVAALTITVSLDKAEVFVDGTSVGTAPFAGAVFVEPGPRRVEAKLGGYETATAAVDATKGAASDVALVMKREVVVQGPPPPSSGVTLTPRAAAPGVVLGALAGAGLVSGVVLVAVGANKHATDTSLGQAITAAHHSCVASAPNFDPQCSTLQSTSSAADTLSRAGVGALVGAGALAAGTVAYFLWPESKPGAPAAGRVRVVPIVSTTSGGMFVSGAF